MAVVLVAAAGLCGPVSVASGHVAEGGSLPGGAAGSRWLSGAVAADGGRAEPARPALPGVDATGPALPLALREEPELKATPQAVCGPESRPEPGMQGRVPAGSTDGFTCNAAALGKFGFAGGYKVLRYVDRAGHECAYYDTTLLFPLNALTLSKQPTVGVVVLDMTDPRNPVHTATLATPAMLSPHESLELNERRGLLAAVMGTPAFHAGHLDIYDLKDDCRAPKLQSSLPVGLLGHESGFAPDGRTFYATSIGGGTITAVDVTDPRAPAPLWVGHYNSHGLTVSDDGNRAYVAARQGLMILDVSEINARRDNPQVRLVGGVRWASLTIPQVAIPVTINGKPYVVEVDEFSHDPEDDANSQSTRVAAHGDRVGAARIIDISDETAPRVVSNLRLEVHQAENRPEIADDPGAQSRLAGYSAHYCNVPRRDDPGIVACSFITSGLRVFDIRDPRHPREAAYYVAPPAALLPRAEAYDWAMSRPAFVRERREIWYSDGASGLHTVRLEPRAWPR